MELLLATQLLPTIAVVIALVLVFRHARAPWQHAARVLQREPRGLLLLEQMRRSAGRARSIALLVAAAAIIVFAVAIPWPIARWAARVEHGGLTIDKAYQIALGEMWAWVLLLGALPLIVGATALVLIVGEFCHLWAARRVLVGAGAEPDLQAELRAGWARSAVLACGVVGALLAVLFAGSLVLLLFTGASWAVACARPGGPKCY